MIIKDLSNSFNPVPKKEKVIKEKSKYIKGKKHKQTKEKEIPKAVKKKVWERDNHKCIFCKREVDMFYANAHLEENVFTACEDCHREQDNGQDTKLYDEKAERYLKSIYGDNWNTK